jgi:hypothetical protein
MTTTTINNPNWDVRRAATKLGFKIVPFFGDPEEARGISNMETKEFGINPTCDEPIFVSLHELAHLVLDHSHVTLQQLFFEFKGASVPEVEAHTVALALAAKLLVDGVDYDQAEEFDYLKSFARTEDNFLSIMRSNKARLTDAADVILAAGLE